MAITVETGTWTASGSTPQTITLADSGLTPVAIVCWVVRAQAAAAGFVATNVMSMGFGTRRSGATQSGCVGVWMGDNLNPGDNYRVRNTTLLSVLTSGSALDYSVSLTAFAAGSFSVSYSSAANSSGDIFGYMVIGGLDDAIVLNATLSSTGATEAETGAGFQANAMMCMDSDLATTGTITQAAAFSFGCATSATEFWSVAMAATDADSCTSAMNWNRAWRTNSCLERLTPNADSSDAQWDLDSFDSDGFTLGVVAAPAATDRIASFLLLKGGVFEAGSKNKSGSTGNDTFTLSNAALDVVGVLMGTARVAAGLGTNNTDICIGAGSTANTTRGSAVNTCFGITSAEAINTQADRFSATDAIIEELTGGTPAETSEAWFDTKSNGSFIIDWAVNGGSTVPIGYLAIGNPGAQSVEATPATANWDTLDATVEPGVVTVEGALASSTWDTLDATAETTVGGLDVEAVPALSDWDTLDATVAAGAVAVEAVPAASTWDTIDATVTTGPVEVEATLASSSWDTLDAGAEAITAAAGEIASSTWDTIDATVATGAVSVEAAPASSTWDTLDATVQAGVVSVEAVPVTSTWDTLDATTLVGAVSVEAVPALSNWDTIDATVQVGAVSVEAVPAAANWDTLDATVQPGAVSVEAVLASSTWDTLDATVFQDAVGAQSVVGEIVNSTWDTLDATVQAGAVEAAAVLASSTWDTIDATVQAVVSVEATFASSTWDTLDATVTPGAVSVEAVPATASWDTLDATVQPGAVESAAVLASSTWDALDATAQAGASSVEAVPALSNWTVLDATVDQTIVAAAVPALSAWSVLDATVVTGAVSVATTPATSTWRSLDATPSLGILEIPTTPAVSLWSCLDATVVIVIRPPPGVGTWARGDRPQVDAGEWSAGDVPHVGGWIKNR